METVTNFANTASRVIWGEPKNTDTAKNETGGKEPIAGETGDVEAGEPYDKGNLDGATEDKPEISSISKDIPSSAELPSTSTEPSSDLPGIIAPTDSVRPENGTDNPGIVLHEATPLTSSEIPAASDDIPTFGPTPPRNAEPSSSTINTQNEKDIDHPLNEPAETSEEHQPTEETKHEADEAAKVEPSGPIPRPLETRIKQGGLGIEDDEVDHLKNEEQGEGGTSEIYVKSTGLYADGGNFDAANPGAAEEADRLLEKRKPHDTTAIAPKQEDSDSSEEKSGKEGKVSLKEKIKAKLHRH